LLIWSIEWLEQVSFNALAIDSIRKIGIAGAKKGVGKSTSRLLEGDDIVNEEDWKEKFADEKTGFFISLAADSFYQSSRVTSAAVTVCCLATLSPVTVSER
jgi:hypothetical protein